VLVGVFVTRKVVVSVNVGVIVGVQVVVAVRVGVGDSGTVAVGVIVGVAVRVGVGVILAVLPHKVHRITILFNIELYL
jgi:hypothetical protein